MPKPKSGESKGDFVSRCMSSAEAKGDFPDQEQRLAFCHSVYDRHKAENMKLAVAIARLQAGGDLRSERLQGREHLVIPAVLVQGQVLHNNLGKTFLPDYEITEDWAEEWNGVPVIINDHPTKRGIAVSARDPEIWNSRGVGYVFDAHVARNGSTQLKADVWLDLSRTEQISELQTVISLLKAGESVELSTGFASVLEEANGTYDGRTYEKILHPQGADHLAIFVDKKGACSLEDGCGLGVHKQVEGETDRWEVYAEEPRKEDATVDGPEGAANSTPCERKTVIGLISKLVGLLTPGSTTNLTAEDGTTLEITAKGTPAVQPEQTGVEFRMLLRRLKALELTNAEIGSAVECTAQTIRSIERGEIRNPTPESLERLKAFYEKKGRTSNAERSDEERRRMLADALDTEFGGKDKFVWIDAVYSEKNQVMFGVMKDELNGVQEQLFQAEFTLSDEAGTEVTFSDPIAVERRVVYEPTGNTTQEEGTMKTDEQKAAEAKAAAEAAQAANASGDTQTAEEKAAAEAKTAEEKATAEAAEQEAANKAAEEKAAADADKSAIAKLEERLAAQDKKLEAQNAEIAELRDVTAPAVEEKERERKALVEELSANEAVPFDTADLEAKPIDELRKLRAMSRGESYAGRGGPRVAENRANDEPRFVEPKPYWETEAATKKEDE